MKSKKYFSITKLFILFTLVILTLSVKIHKYSDSGDSSMKKKENVETPKEKKVELKEKNEKADKVEKSQKVEKTEKVDKTKKNEKSEKVEKIEKPKLQERKKAEKLNLKSKNETSPDDTKSDTNSDVINISDLFENNNTDKNSTNKDIPISNNTDADKNSNNKDIPISNNTDADKNSTDKDYYYIPKIGGISINNPLPDSSYGCAKCKTGDVIPIPSRPANEVIFPEKPGVKFQPVKYVKQLSPGGKAALELEEINE